MYPSLPGKMTRDSLSDEILLVPCRPMGSYAVACDCVCMVRHCPLLVYCPCIWVWHNSSVSGSCQPSGSNWSARMTVCPLFNVRNKGSPPNSRKITLSPLSSKSRLAWSVLIVPTGFSGGTSSSKTVNLMIPLHPANPTGTFTTPIGCVAPPMPLADSGFS